MHGVASRVLPIFASLALLLSACGPNVGDGETGGSPAAEPRQSLFVYGQGYRTSDVIAQARVDYFSELFPNIRVGFSESGFDPQVFLAALQGGDPPDVVRIPRNRIGSYIARGVLAPLTDCIQEHAVDTSVFYESAMASVTVDGTVYALPEFYDTRIWLVNDGVFAEAGLDPTTFEWSDWDAIREANQAILQTDGDQVQRIGIDPKIPEFLELWALANGGRLISEDGRESLLDTLEVEEALRFTVDLINAHGGVTPFLDFRGSPEFGDFFGAENQFATNTIGAHPMEEWYLNVLANNSPDVDISAYPFMGRDGEPVTVESGSGWAILAGSPKFDAACNFITTVTDEEAWVRAATARAEERAAEGKPFTGVYSGNRAADERIFGEGGIVDLSEYPTFEQAVEAVLEGQRYAVGFPPSPAAEEFVEAVNAAVDAALTGTDPAEALAAADQEAQNAIDAAAP